MKAMTRNEYEAAGGTMSDDECDSYGVRHGEFSVSEYGQERHDTMQLARQRVWAIDAERAAKPKTTARAMVECDCGHMASHRMSTARGSACPACYDRMSE